MKEDIKWIHSEEMDFHTYIWSHESKTPDKVFYLVHGSVEHAKRYEAFAKSLVELGFVVVAPDLRGHGQTGLKAGQLGHFTNEAMGWSLCVHDLKIIYNYIAQAYPALPIVLFGHSMGSYLVRTFIKEYPVDLSGLIISGTGGFATGIGDMGIWLSKLVMHFKGYDYKSKFLTSLVYDSLNKRIGPVSTPFDFLSRDSDEVKTYIEDPLCGYICSAEFIHEMLTGTKLSNQEAVFDLKGWQLPILLISGANDPVGDRKSKGVKGVYKNYRRYNNQVAIKLYDDARHELLNELNKNQVIEDIHRWLLSLFKTC